MRRRRRGCTGAGNVPLCQLLDYAWWNNNSLSV